MMPAIVPLRIPSAPPTEYKKERERFAEMEAEFRARKGRRAFGWLRRVADGLRRRRAGWAPARRLHRRQAATG